MPEGVYLTDSSSAGARLRLDPKPLRQAHSQHAQYKIISVQKEPGVRKSAATATTTASPQLLRLRRPRSQAIIEGRSEDMAIRDNGSKDDKEGVLKTFKVYQFDHTTESGKAPLFVKPGKHFWQRYRWHFRRWWWLYALILFIIIVLLVVLLVVYLAYPSMAQNRVDNSMLVLEDVQLTDTTNATYHINIKARLASKSSYNPILDPFNVTLRMTGESTAFVTVPVPQLKVTSSSPFTISEDVDISDSAAFASFVQAFITSTEVPIMLDGTTVLRDGALPAQNVEFNKEFSSDGLNSLQGLTMQNVTILAQPDSRSNNFFADLYINNPSQFTIDFGNATFDNYFNNSIFGWSYVDNMMISPGPNVLRLRAITDTRGIEAAVQQQPYCSNGTLPITLKPRFVFDQVMEINYFQQALQPLNLTLQANIGPTTSQVLGKSITCP